MSGKEQLEESERQNVAREEKQSEWVFLTWYANRRKVTNNKENEMERNRRAKNGRAKRIREKEKWHNKLSESSMSV